MFASVLETAVSEGHATRRHASALVIAVVAGCSGGTATPPGNGGPLDDGAQIMAALEIPAGATVTIPPGAHIVAASGVVITVRGVLAVASSAGPHARIAAATPQPAPEQAWGGIVVESGGRLDADGLDLAGATSALAVNAGSLGARYDDGTISDSQVPLQIAAGARLDSKHATVVNAGAASGISGELHASYLDYQTSADVVGGLIMGDASAIFDVTDSTFHGVPGGGNDYIISYASSLVHVAYSTIIDAHCAFHFDDVSRFEIDHVTAGAATPGGPGGEVVYGAMLYGSGDGPNVISDSNFMGSGFDLDQQNPNGPLSITNTYAVGHVALVASTEWPATDRATAPISGAKPR